jgi:hypothetical protein
MQYFELIAAEAVTPEQCQTTAALGPFVVEAVDEQAARMLIAINYATSSGGERGGHIPVSIWDDASASEARRLSLEPGALRPRQALADGRDTAPEHIDELELREGGRVVARMIWWPCGAGDIYPFGDAMLLDFVEGPAAFEIQLEPV